MIQTKKYKPTGLPSDIVAKYEEPEEFTDEELEQILNLLHYENSQYDNQEQYMLFVARTAVGNLNKMGMAIAKRGNWHRYYNAIRTKRFCLALLTLITYF